MTPPSSLPDGPPSSADAHRQPPPVAHLSILGEEWVPPHLENAQRPLLPRWNLAASEESTGQSSGSLILLHDFVDGVGLLMVFLLLIWTSFELWTSRLEEAVGLHIILEDFLYFTKEKNFIFS
jgi:hypothetical protein